MLSWNIHSFGRRCLDCSCRMQNLKSYYIKHGCLLLLCLIGLYMPPIPEMRCTSAHVCLCVKPSLSNFVVWRLSACGMSHMFVPYTGPSLPSAQRGCPCALVKLFYARLGGFPLSNKKLKIGYSSSPCNKGFTEFAPPELGMPKVPPLRARLAHLHQGLPYLQFSSPSFLGIGVVQANLRPQARPSTPRLRAPISLLEPPAPPLTTS